MRLEQAVLDDLIRFPAKFKMTLFGKGLVFDRSRSTRQTCHDVVTRTERDRPALLFFTHENLNKVIGMVLSMNPVAI